MVGLIYLWPYVQMDFAESARYSEKDSKKYEFYTPALLKNMPRVTKDYGFGFPNIAGPGLLIYELQFHGTADTSQIDAYLVKYGYKKSATCDIQGDCWTGADPKVTVSVGIINDPETLIVSMAKEP
ncbi:hypothetical protein ACFFJN_02810 [Erwinia mallotivora]|uniref:hypothetical protein n=1 Tax=Erwinia mallotivora TaxID=69222 RepID=UPI0035EE35F3